MMPASLVATEVDALPRGQAVAPHRPDGRSLVCGGVPGHGARAYRLRGVQAGAAPERTLPRGRHGFSQGVDETLPMGGERGSTYRGERWSPRSHETRDLLERYAVPHAFYPVDSEGGRALLRSAGRTAERLPVWVLFDERVLVDPSNEEAADVLNTAEGPPEREKADFDVVVAGGGPAGLTAAAMMAGYGARVAVLDAAPGPAKHSRAAVVHARTLEVLGALGVVDEALHEGVIVPHFGVRDRDRRLLAVDFDGLPTPHPYTLMLPQDDTEGLLRRALRRRGAEIAWGREVVRVRQDAGGVELTICSPRGEERVRAKHVLACDGALFGAGRGGDTLRGRDVPPVVRARGRAHGVGSARRRGTALFLPRGSRRGGPAAWRAPPRRRHGR